jgi:hypothetical protein
MVSIFQLFSLSTNVLDKEAILFVPGKTFKDSIIHKSQPGARVIKQITDVNYGFRSYGDMTVQKIGQCYKTNSRKLRTLYHRLQTNFHGRKKYHFYVDLTVACYENKFILRLIDTPFKSQVEKPILSF